MYFRPTRYAPSHRWASELGASFIESGPWLRAQWFPRPGESDWFEPTCREVQAVRSGVGLCDVSTLGKIDVQGPDALKFIEGLYANNFASLAVGRTRYGIMLREDGFVFDDGTAARLAEDRYLITTTTSHAVQVYQHMHLCNQTLWPELDVQFVRSLTSGHSSQWPVHARVNCCSACSTRAVTCRTRHKALAENLIGGDQYLWDRSMSRLAGTFLGQWYRYGYQRAFAPTHVQGEWYGRRDPTSGRMLERIRIPQWFKSETGNRLLRIAVDLFPGMPIDEMANLKMKRRIASENRQEQRENTLRNLKLRALYREGKSTSDPTVRRRVMDEMIPILSEVGQECAWSWRDIDAKMKELERTYQHEEMTGMIRAVMSRPTRASRFKAFTKLLNDPYRPLLQHEAEYILKNLVGRNSSINDLRQKVPPRLWEEYQGEIVEALRRWQSEPK